MRSSTKSAKPRSFAAHLLKTKCRTAFGGRITPPFVTLYVTTRCDEKCIHCYYWDELNPAPNRDFQLEEFEQTLNSMDEIYNLFIGGGEPFLRPDLADIFLAAERTNHVANLYVPTNGQHTERTVDVLEKTLAGAPRMRFHLNLSVDHTDEQKHDFIRGKKNAYQRMLRTLEAIRPIRRRFPNLIVHTLTTLMKENQDEIFDIYEELKRRFEPDGVSFNYCRGNPLDPAQTDVDPAIYEKLVKRMEADFSQGRLQRSGLSAYGAGNHLLDQARTAYRRANGHGGKTAVLERLRPAGLRHLQQRRRRGMRNQEQQPRQPAGCRLRLPQAVVQRKCFENSRRGCTWLLLHPRMRTLLVYDLSADRGQPDRDQSGWEATVTEAEFG